MQMTRDNLSPWWVVMLCQCAAILVTLFAAQSSAADNDDPRHNKPANPISPEPGPTAKDVPRPVASPLISNAPSVSAPSVPTPASKSAEQLEMDERMRELARRMAASEKGASDAVKSATDAVVPPLSALTQEENELAQARADQANQQSFSKAQDSRPLAARRSQPTSTEPLPKPGSSSSMLTVITALGVVITLILLLRAGMKKVLGGAAAVGNSSVVQVLTRVAVAPRSHVVLLRVGGRILVVSDSAAGMRTLSQIDAPEEVADILTAVSSAKSTSVTSGFRQMLASVGAGYEPEAPTSEAGSDHDEFRIDRARDKVSGLLGKLRNLTGKGGAP